MRLGNRIGERITTVGRASRGRRAIAPVGGAPERAISVARQTGVGHVATPTRLGHVAWLRPKQLAWAAALTVLLTSGLSSMARAYEQRTGTPSVGIQFGAGMMEGSDAYQFGNLDPVPYDIFGSGFGLGIHIRYSLDRRSAIGATFEDLRFRRKSGALPVASEYQVNNFLGRYYVYFARRQKVSRYLVGGIGFHRPSIRSGEQTTLPGEGFTANLGAGLEYFLTRVITIDGSLDGYLLRPKGGSITAAEARIGLHYYFSR